MGGASSIQETAVGSEVTDFETVVHKNKKLQAELDKLRNSTSSKSVTSFSTPEPKLSNDATAQQANASTEPESTQDAPNIEKRRDSGEKMNSQEFSIHEAISNRAATALECALEAIPLPRGGVYVKTGIGPIQFGIPPETIKDSLNLGLSVPTFYVVPHERFNLDLGINVAEIEFPAYYNFFFIQKSVHLIVTPEQERDLRRAFKETIEGPADEHLLQDQEYGKFTDPEIYKARPDFKKEMAYFIEPRGGRTISCDTMVQWTQFNKQGVAKLEQTNEDGTKIVIEVIDTNQNYHVVENGVEVAIVSHSQACFVPAPENINGWLQANSENSSNNIVVNYEASSDDEPDGDTDDFGHNNLHAIPINCHDHAQQFRLKMMMNTMPFDPPDFGITMLGTSHGFDQAGTTTGFIVWMYGYGVAVDPPPHCDTYLMLNGVSPRLITAVILTHCHADHDAGTFQKVLKERRITLITTPTIYQHFIRKYSAVSGLKAAFLNRLLDFQPVNIAEPFHFHGAVFEFFYSLHPLPCIGFKVVCGKKSMSYSADTLNDKESFDKLEERGIISSARKKSLLAFPWDCDIVLHECGVPPTHTAPATLQAQPKSVQEKLYAVHISDKAAKEAGLRKALPGFSNTIVIPNAPRLSTVAIDTLQLCAATDVFRDADIFQCIKVLQMSSRKRFRKGTVYEGFIGGVFFIVSEGALQVEREGKPPMLMELGDYFGEISAMNGLKEKMKLTTLTDVEVINLDKYAFNQFLMSCPTAHERLKTLDSMRSQGFANALRFNSVFRGMTFPQRTQLQSLAVTNREIAKGEKVYAHDDKATSLIIICKGKFSVVGPDAETNPQAMEVSSQDKSLDESSRASRADIHNFAGMHKVVGHGCVFIPANVYNEVVLGASAQQINTTHSGLALIGDTDGVIFEVSAKGFAGFLDRNPGIQLALMKHSSGVVV